VTSSIIYLNVKIFKLLLYPLCRTPYVYTLKNVMNTEKKKLLLALGNVYTKVLESVKHPPD